VEAACWRAILGAVRDGATTPGAIDTVLTSSVAPDRMKDLSRSYLSSQRSGAVSRMADLGLVIRVRDGSRMTHKATAAGDTFLETTGNP
jgi:hypothetical protein